MFDFTYYNPVKVIFGEKKISDIGKEISRKGIKKVLLLAGGGSIKKNGVYKSVISSMNENGMEVIEKWGVRPNPELNHTLEAIDLAREFNAEAVLAVGGGSVIDEAKSICAGYYLDNIWDAYEMKVAIDKALPLFTVLTLSATASEMNMFAVLMNDKEKKKWAIGSPHIYPKTTIIDPSVQVSLPWNQTVNGGIDALSHVMEFYFRGTDQEINISVCESLMHTLIMAVDKLQNNPQDISSRSNLAWSATMALNGFATSALLGGEWSVHGIEHGLSAFDPKIAHAEGLAVLFPAWILYTQETNAHQYNRWAKKIWGKDSVEDAVKEMKKKYTSWQAPVCLRDLNIVEQDIPEIARLSTLRGSLGSMRKLDRKDVENILKIAY